MQEYLGLFVHTVICWLRVRYDLCPKDADTHGRDAAPHRSPLARLGRHRGFAVLFDKSPFLLQSTAPAVSHLCVPLLMELLLHLPPTLPFPPEQIPSAAVCLGMGHSAVVWCFGVKNYWILPEVLSYWFYGLNCANFVLL